MRKKILQDPTHLEERKFGKATVVSIRVSGLRLVFCYVLLRIMAEDCDGCKGCSVKWRRKGIQLFGYKETGEC